MGSREFGIPAIQTYGRGLEGLVVTESAVGSIDGKQGVLRYRGYDVRELASRLDFEQVAYLVLNGELPDEQQRVHWHEELVRWRRPPRQAFAALDRVPEQAHPLAQYRTMLTVAACHIEDAEDTSSEAQWRKPGRLLSWSAALAAGAIRHLKGLRPVEPREDLGFSAHFLYQALGREPTTEEERAFDASLIVQAEHGLHAAAFAALTVISTGADLGSAVLAGMGALSGALHGGANQLAWEDLEPLSSPEEARAWAKKRLGQKYRFPGYGHRVYKCPDPRVKVLEPYARELLASRGDLQRWQTYLAFREEVEGALSQRGIYANVDSITGLVYQPLGLHPSAFPIPFCLAIQTGWMARCLEYLDRGGKMIEPGAVYVGR